MDTKIGKLDTPSLIERELESIGGDAYLCAMGEITPHEAMVSIQAAAKTLRVRLTQLTEERDGAIRNRDRVLQEIVASKVYPTEADIEYQRANAAEARIQSLERVLRRCVESMETLINLDKYETTANVRDDLNAARALLSSVPDGEGK